MDVDDFIELLASQTHRSKDVVRKDLETSIKKAFIDPDTKERMHELFGNEIPSIEEYLKHTVLKRKK